MTFTGQHSEQYVTGRELGKGGEGNVYELQSHPALVLKRYNEPPTKQKLQKLQLMATMRTPAIEAFAAWPIDVVDDGNGGYGFVMKKLVGYVPLHHVFSPMDRKKMFADKGYNFLVHVARNVATAFHHLHEAELVVGDVNEGNILVSASGMIAFIDCDSFQVRHGDDYFFCEVGIPRYTPPELLKKKTFENVVRTTNTDNFSMAILLFQLLFLGRHPFAGKNKSAGDMDEETAIRLGHFAYSLTAERKKLTPPPNSLPISSLPEDVVQLFHRAFEAHERPAPAEWIKVLDRLLAHMTTCSMSRLHSYPAGLSECPWCAFRRQQGIMYFLDDSYIQANSALGNIEQFINGFRPKMPDLKKWSYSGTMPVIKPMPVPKAVRRERVAQALIVIGLMAVIAGVVIFTSAISVPIGVGTGLILVHTYRSLNELDKERTKRRSNYEALAEQMQALQREYEYPAEMGNYHRQLDALQKAISSFRLLPDELDRRIKLQEEELYNEQLDDYLRQFDIKQYSIPSIGETRKDALYNAGIYNAAHISRLATTKVPGIGPAYQQVLYSWRRQMSAGFVYIPDNYRLGKARERATAEVSAIKVRLEQQIRAEYQALNFLYANITNHINSLEYRLNTLHVKLAQAGADKEAI
jgi:DNA-binding helix-hairpin-helix protein with protein kinase domain